MIRSFRLRMKLSQKEMAWVLKTNRGTYSCWESRYVSHVPSWLYKRYRKYVLRLIWKRIVKWVKN
jgi:DNA-binding transcriptional regulator YiaG